MRRRLKDLRGWILFFLLCEDFGKLKNVVFYFDFGVVTNRRSCESEACRFLSWGKIQRQFTTQYTEGGRVSIL
jgi:hypothetical protein